MTGILRPGFAEDPDEPAGVVVARKYYVIIKRVRT